MCNMFVRCISDIYYVIQCHTVVSAHFDKIKNEN